MSKKEKLSKKKKKKTKKIKGGTGSHTRLWALILSQAGGQLAQDLDKRLNAVTEVILESIEKKNNKKFQKLENKINRLEQRIIDISSENEGLTRTISEFVS